MTKQRRAMLLLSTAMLVSVLALLSVSVVMGGRQSARERWEQHGPRHYLLDITIRGDQTLVRMQIEVRDGTMLKGVDLNTGRALSAERIARYYTILPVERLFDRIELQSYGARSLRHRIAGSAPWLARQLGWCVIQPLRAEYDSALGYPKTFQFRHNVCARKEPFAGELRVRALD
ncbi:hypothetical protein HC891_14195 [Candidatus Gracilibacteria bacterium]|nr:hypothetical protein [Candidatus Gracilibacteria bacterium]